MDDDALRRLLLDHQFRYGNVSAFLRTVRFCLGTDGENGYRYLYGSTKAHEVLFGDESRHPNIRKVVTQSDGTVGYTTAAGAYMIEDPVWQRIRFKLDLPDFGPVSQDRAATCLVFEHGQLTNVELGRISRAFDVMWKVWPQLPASNYDHFSKSDLGTVVAVYEAEGGKLL